ncbi:MAG TPA: DUF488 domain-containing protein [Thermomicrobiales bacterium]|nr:DUF488 domain-containing protein [Thermomicrobiales bacterium]
MNCTSQPVAGQVVYTVGHSNQPAEEFLDLLRQHEIEVVVDVRSSPFSRFVPQFNKRELQATVREAGFQYVYLGRELGGRPDPGSDLIDDEGHAIYGLIAETNAFNDGLRRLLEGIGRYRVALMCSEEDPTDCHRRLLVARVLILDHGIDVRHIRGDGRIDTEDDLTRMPYDAPIQQSLFGSTDDDARKRAWRSIRSVLPRNLRDSSSTS